ncbi:3'-5' exonuclease [Bdellovibrionota bacterium FG-2]
MDTLAITPMDMTQPFLALDFETANHARDSACSIGLVRVEGGEIVAKEVHLIKPPSRDFVFTYIHGLSWRDVAQAPDFGELWEKISPLFKGVKYLAAHNARFDSGVLKACCARYGVEFPQQPFLCTVELARAQWGIRPTKLSDVCRTLEIELNHHEALSDALACAKIVLSASRAQVGSGVN